MLQGIIPRRHLGVWTIYAILIIPIGCVMSGCNEKTTAAKSGSASASVWDDLLTSKHYDVCIMVDHSGSTRGKKVFNDTLRQISSVYLSNLRTSPENSVSLQHGGSVNSVVYEGRGKGLKDLREKLNDLADGKEDPNDKPITNPAYHDRHIPIPVDEDGAKDGLGNGSPIVETLLTPALAWVNDRPAKNDKLVIIVSDLINDPTKFVDGTVQHYLDPATFKWTVKNPQSVHVRVYMIDTTTINRVQSAWEPSGIDMRFFRAGYSVDKGDLTPREEQ